MPRQITSILAHEKRKKQSQAAPWKFAEGGQRNAQHGINGLTTDPGLNAKPAANDESAKDGGNVGATNTEGSAHKDGEGDAVFPYLVPAWALRSMGIKTIRLPRRMARKA
jgi:hypothetical protein